jgi:hypothetical protein
MMFRTDKVEILEKNSIGIQPEGDILIDEILSVPNYRQKIHLQVLKFKENNRAHFGILEAWFR